MGVIRLRVCSIRWKNTDAFGRQTLATETLASEKNYMTVTFFAFVSCLTP